MKLKLAEYEMCLYIVGGQKTKD